MLLFSGKNGIQLIFNSVKYSDCRNRLHGVHTALKNPWKLLELLLIKSSPLKVLENKQVLENLWKVTDFLAVLSLKSNKWKIHMHWLLQSSFTEISVLIYFLGFRTLTRLLVEANCIAEGDADVTVWQYTRFLDAGVATHKSSFLDSTCRTDQLYHGLLAQAEDYTELWVVVKLVLLLSRRRAMSSTVFQWIQKWVIITCYQIQIVIPLKL